MKYDAITIDTQVVCTNGYDLDNGLLAQLKQFANGPVRVVVSQIVASELLRQMKDKVEEAVSSIKSSHKDGVRYGLYSRDASPFAEEPDAASVAKSRLQKYFEEIGAEIVPYDNVQTNEVLDLYFRAKAPFSGKGKKKSEFPDAIALLSLEEWAKKNKLKLLAVSGDGDWQRFAKNSEAVVVVEKLQDALAELQEHAEQVAQVAQKILSKIVLDDQSDLNQTFERQLEYEVSGLSLYTEADSSFNVESEQADVSLTSFELVGGPDAVEAHVVQASDEKIVMSIDLNATVGVEAYFNFSIHDSIDDDDVGLGSSVETKEFEFELTVLATFEGDFSSDDFDLTEIEIVSAPKSVYFGTVHPDWDDTPPDDEPINEEEPWTLEEESGRGEL